MHLKSRIFKIIEKNEENSVEYLLLSLHSRQDGKGPVNRGNLQTALRRLIQQGKIEQIEISGIIIYKIKAPIPTEISS